MVLRFTLVSSVTKLPFLSEEIVREGFRFLRKQNLTVANLYAILHILHIALGN